MGFVSSMSRKGNFYDNTVDESFMKTLKYEEAYREEHRDLAHASIGRFLEQVCTRRWAISRRWNSSTGSCGSSAQTRGRWERLRKFGSLQYEFFEAFGNPSPNEFLGKYAGAVLAGPLSASSV